jgi:hypothetical protein
MDILDSIDELTDDEFPDDFDTDAPAEELELAVDESEMSKDEALEITEAIRSAATATYILLSQAHEGKAYKALGYSTWADYVKTEFDISSQRSYQLLDLSKTIDAIEAATPEGTQVRLTEAQARDIKRELPRITQIIKEETADRTPEEASETVDRIVEDIREQQKADQKAIDEKERKLEEAEQDGYHRGLEAAADALLEADGPGSGPSSADDEFIEVEVAGEAGRSPQDSMYLYNFFNLLVSGTSLPEPDDFINIIPDNRADEVDDKLLVATAWLNRFQTLWEMRRSE